MKKFLLSLCFLGLGAQALGSDTCTGRQSFDNNWPYHNQVGWEQFAVGVGAGIRIEGRCDLIRVQAQTEANVWVFGESFAVGQAYVSSSWRDTNQRVLSSRVTLLGFELDSQELRADDALAFQSQSDFDFDQEGDVSFSIGPFAVPLRYGVTGASNFLLAATTDGLKIRANIQPDIETHAYAQLGANIPFVALTLKGTILVLKDEIDIEAGASLVEGKGDLLLYFDASLDKRFRALVGQLSGSAKVGVIGDREFEQDFFSWEGYELDDVLLSINDLVRL